MERQFKGVFIPSEIWLADYKTINERYIAIRDYITKEYGENVAKAGGFVSGK